MLRPELMLHPLNSLVLDVFHPPLNPHRQTLMHHFQPELGYIDDVVTLNTQVSTQYDGLRICKLYRVAEL